MRNLDSRHSMCYRKIKKWLRVQTLSVHVINKRLHLCGGKYIITACSTYSIYLQKKEHLCGGTALPTTRQSCNHTRKNSPENGTTIIRPILKNDSSNNDRGSGKGGSQTTSFPGWDGRGQFFFSSSTLLEQSSTSSHALNHDGTSSWRGITTTSWTAEKKAYRKKKYVLYSWYNC